MVSIYKIEKEEVLSTGVYALMELRGLAADTKPTEIQGRNIDNGSTFIEMDTGKTHYYDLENEQWVDPSSNE